MVIQPQNMKPKYRIPAQDKNLRTFGIAASIVINNN